MDRELYLVAEPAAHFFLPASPFAIGLPLGKTAKKPPFVLSHEMSTLRGATATANVIEIDDEQLTRLLDGEDINCDPSLEDHVLIKYQHLCLGLGRARNGKLKNKIPRSIINF